jgi:hypothetical protein
MCVTPTKHQQHQAARTSRPGPMLPHTRPLATQEKPNGCLVAGNVSEAQGGRGAWIANTQAASSNPPKMCNSWQVLTDQRQPSVAMGCRGGM